MVKPGEFITTRLGVGLVLNNYYGDPDVFMGNKHIIVGDVIYPGVLRKQIEIRGYIPQQATSLDMQEIVKGIFEEVYTDEN